MYRIMTNEEKLKRMSEYVEALANYVCEVMGAHELMRIAVENCFSKEECLNYFIHNEELYEQVKKEFDERLGR